MPEDNKKEKLISFLDKKAFEPILKADPEKYPEKDRKTLDQLKKKTESLKKRYQGYRNAGQVRQEFRDDLTSEPAKKVDRELKRLKLPTLPDIKDEFFAYADKLGVTAERETRRHHKPNPPHPWHKSKPEEREKAWRELKEEIREGNKAAKETLKEHEEAKK